MTRAGDVFWTALPTYLAMGMTPEEFWHGEPRLAVAYRESFEIRREMQFAREWRLGIYMMRAVAACLVEDAEYPDAPLFSSEALKAEYEEAKAKATLEKNMAAFEAMAKRANEKLAARGEGD